MTLDISAPLHFAAEFLLLAVCVGAAFESLRGRRGPAGSMAVLQAAGFAGLAVAQGLHGARVLEADAAQGLIIVRTVSYGLLALGARPSAPDVHAARGARAPQAADAHAADALAVPAVVMSSKAPGWSLAPAVAAALVAMRGYAAHRKDQDPATFAFAAAFAGLAAAEVATFAGGQEGGNWLAAAHTLRAASAFLLARWLWTSLVRSIRLRFVAAFIAALLVLVLVISASVTQVIGSNVEREELTRISAAARSEVTALTPLRQRALTGSTTLALQSQDLANGIRTANKKSLQNLSVAALRNLFPDVDFMLVVDARGRLLAAASSTPGNRGRIAAMDVVQSQAIAGSDLIAAVTTRLARGDTIDTAGPQTVIVVGASAVQRGTTALGAVALGYRIDRDFLTSLARRQAPGAIASVLNGGEVVATTGDVAEATRGLARGRTGELVRRHVVERGGTYSAATKIGGQTYFTAAVPLKRTIDGQTVAVLTMSRPATSADLTQKGINQILFVVTLVAAAMAALIAWLAGGRITRPIRRLTDAAERVRGGDLETRADVEATDEVGALGAAFNEMTGSLVQLTDELREAADEEAALRAQMEAIMQSMGDGLIATDAKGHIVAFNRAAEQIVGRDARRALGKALPEVLRSANGRPSDVAQIALGGGGEAEIVREDGGFVPVALTSAPLRDPAGQPGGRVIVFRDISREAEAERMKTEFLSNVSHELRTPLTPIKGYTEILKRKQFPRQKALGFLDGILESTTRLERIVEILVDFAAMEAGRLKARTEPVDVRAFSTGLVQRWKQRATGHTFAVEVPAGLPRVDADPRLLAKGVDELFDNAVKFSPRARNGRKPRIVVEAEATRAEGVRYVRLSVRDHGIGIEPDAMPSIFQDFRQLDGSETRPYGGLGLGLAYAKRVVEVHRGWIEVESTPGKGSTFSLLLPLADTKRGGSAPRATKTKKPARKAARK